MIALKECTKNNTDERFLVIGGYDDVDRPTKTAEIFSGGSSGGFFLTGSMSVERVRHAVVCLANGKALVTGGIDASGHILNSAEIYDITTGLFHPVAGRDEFGASRAYGDLADQ
ncbi:MAG: kelch repeat-containing protein [Candidatus Manganitrophus sp.]|nr:kelch repeat-containing protein [Candidatus Manganitrophus sp.]